MESILEKYKIKFLERIIFDRPHKLIYSINDVFDQCISDYKTVEEVNNFLISEIDKVLNGISSEETIISESCVSVEISNDISKFYQEIHYLPGSPPDFLIPTQDFRKIAELWLHYLRSS